MKRAFVVILAVVALAGCSDAKDKPAGPRFTTTTVEGRPAWLDALGAPNTVEEGVAIRANDGTTERVWVDKQARMVYARTCELAKLATQEGAYYGPGNFGPVGFASSCPGGAPADAPLRRLPT